MGTATEESPVTIAPSDEASASAASAESAAQEASVTPSGAREQQGTAAIEVCSVSRSFGDVRAVAELSFTVGRGEIVGLLGPNGAGKTTLLRMLATLIRPDQGSVRIMGADTIAEPLRVRAQLGYQTGDTGLYGRLTPIEFLRYFARLQGIGEADAKARIEVLSRDFGLDEFAKRHCATLSTGQKQRVSLARALLHDPPVLVLDEPTSGLDILSSSFVLEALRAAARAGRAVLFSTHILSEVELVCDRVLLLHRGSIVARGTVAELCAQSGEDALARAFLRLVA